MMTRSGMTQFTTVQVLVAFGGAVFAGVLGVLAFPDPQPLAYLGFYNYANLIIATVMAIFSVYYLYTKVYPAFNLIDSSGEERTGLDASEQHESLAKVPWVISGASTALAIGVSVIMGILLWEAAECGLVAAKMVVSLTGSWCLIALLDYYILRLFSLSVAQELAKHFYVGEPKTRLSTNLFQRLVVGGFIVSAVSGILVATVLHGCFGAGASVNLGPGLARVAGAFALTQALAAGVLYFLGTSIARPLNQLMRLTTKVGSGDLTVRFSGVTGDEIELLGASFNNMVESLRRMTLQLEEVMEQVTAVSASIMEIAEQQTHRGEERTVAVTQISASIENVSITAQMIAEHCESMARSAEHALERSMEGQKLVGDTAEGMERIRDTVAAMSRHILSLGEKSKQIGDIIETISGIADETHLLALNAAIESAGAGEHGRRFAVVANEVKRLAQRAVAETSGIRKILTEIQTAANASVLATEQGIKEVETGARLAHGAREAINGVITLVEDTAKKTREISDATEQQKQANLQIVSSMREITAASREAAAANKQSRAAARSLTELAETLSVITRLFNVHGPSEAAEVGEPQKSTQTATN